MSSPVTLKELRTCGDSKGSTFLIPSGSIDVNKMSVLYSKSLHHSVQVPMVGQVLSRPPPRVGGDLVRVGRDLPSPGP